MKKLDIDNTDENDTKLEIKNDIRIKKKCFNYPKPKKRCYNEVKKDSSEKHLKANKTFKAY